MAPDLNSLPSSRGSNAPASSLAERPRRISFTSSTSFGPTLPSPQSPTSSLQQATNATIPEGQQQSPGNESVGRTVSQRRSILRDSLLAAHPRRSGAGEPLHALSGSDLDTLGPQRQPSNQPAHARNLSIGEIHQQLENEQEAQVNRLLYMIRLQQDELAAQSAGHSHDPASVSPTEQHALPTATPLPHPPGQLARNSSSRHSSSRFSASSRGVSPAMRPVSSSGPTPGDILLGGARDEPAFYQAETQMLSRENQMLKQRIRELERQISDLSVSSNAGTEAFPTVATHMDSEQRKV